MPAQRAEKLGESGLCCWPRPRVSSASVGVAMAPVGPLGSSTWAESAYEIPVGTESVSSRCFQIGVLGCL